ncbi:hypothetical protein MSG28_009025 [Choristoneura fumiferana]|uniref:Uncharacterized protein n=1 Tax=Choristoneura fumiferana TaxID=7141 RepID=A0ACC0J8Z7_CHOFU|nr:hypothetical protein MSG28_009025 [Choristoneura fumiferana]
MAADTAGAAAGAGAGGASPEETLESLLREAEALKQKLEEERQKLNDVTLASVAERLEAVNFPNLKPRRVLKGHQAKVLNSSSASREYCPSTASIRPLAVTWRWHVAGRQGGGGRGRGLRKRTVATHTSYVAACVFPRTERQLLTGSGDGAAALWGVGSGQLLQTFQGHAADVLALDPAPSDTGDTFASGGADRAVLVWDMRSGAAVQAFDAHRSDVTSVRFHPGGDALASGCDDAACRLFDLRADREVARYAKDSIIFGVNSVEWSLSGRLLFAGYSDYTASAWDALRATRVCVLCGHEHRVSRLQLAPDGAALATASWDTTLRVSNTRHATRDTRHTATASWDTTLRVSRHATRDTRHTATASWDTTLRVSRHATRDTRHTATASWDTTLRRATRPGPPPMFSNISFLRGDDSDAPTRSRLRGGLRASPSRCECFFCILAILVSPVIPRERRILLQAVRHLVPIHCSPVIQSGQLTAAVGPQSAQEIPSIDRVASRASYSSPATARNGRTMRRALSCLPLALLLLANVVPSKAQKSAAGEVVVRVRSGAPLQLECALRVEQRAEWRREDGRPLPPELRPAGEAPVAAPARQGLRARLRAPAAAPHMAGVYACAAGPDAQRLRLLVEADPGTAPDTARI